jgi:transcriptional regulator GlxA family with amidase domain
MRFGFVIFPEVEELDFIGPWEMATLWQQVADGPQCIVIAERAEPVICAKGLSVNPHVSFADCPQLDFLLVPGGWGTRKEVSNAALLSFIATQAKSCQAVLSVCTGSCVLHAAGLLSGRRATTHWGSLDRLRALGDVQVVEERFTRDGNIWCAAGVSAGIDLTLSLIAEVAGADAAGSVQFAAEYYPSSARYGEYTSDPRAPAYIKET